VRGGIAGGYGSVWRALSGTVARERAGDGFEGASHGHEGSAGGARPLECAGAPGSALRCLHPSRDPGRRV